MPRLIHPTAIISPEAELPEDVQVGPYVIIEGPVRLGPGCVIEPYCRLIGPIKAGTGNRFGTGVVVGTDPQHVAYEGDQTLIEIGDNNTFREFVTVHRPLKKPNVTRIGSRNLFMVNSHVAHDCLVGNDCLFANGALLAGHVIVHDRAFISGNSAVHQFCRIGRLALLSGTTSITQDLPPFFIAQGSVNMVGGINIIGMKRAGFPSSEITAVRKAFRIICHRGLTISAALEMVVDDLGESPAVQEMVQFIRESKRGVSVGVERSLNRTWRQKRDEPEQSSAESPKRSDNGGAGSRAA